MDPQTALHQLLHNLHDGDRVAILQNLASLTDWIENNGFLPTVQIDTIQNVEVFLVTKDIS